MSCHAFWRNQFRLLLSGLACVLVEGLCRLALGGTALAKASPNRIRLTLLRIGAVVLRNTRRIRLLPGSACAHRELFRAAALRPPAPRHLLAAAECCPGATTKNGGWGRCLRKFANPPD